MTCSTTQPLRHDPPAEASDALPPIPEFRQVTQDYASTGLSLKKHPIAFLRGWLEEQNVTPAERLRDETRCPHNRRLTVAGLCTIRQRPATGRGIIFMTLEDETGLANLVVHPATYRRYRVAARDASAMLVRGHVGRRDAVVHLVAERIEDLSDRLAELSVRSRDFR